MPPVRSNLFNRGFVGLMVTQFFGAANDNVLKQVLSFSVALGGIWYGARFTVSWLGIDLPLNQGYVGLCLTIPFIIFSGYAGQIADRISKQRMTVFVKVAEICIALIALIGFWTMNLWLCMAAMILLAIQSAFFGPAKYGMIPELVDDHELSRANGAINMFTNIAVIAGTLLAGPIYGAFHPASRNSTADGLLWLPGAALVLIAVCGFCSSLLIPRLEAKDPTLKFDFNPVGTYWKSIVEMRGKPILWVALAWSFFYMVGMISILILPDYRALLNVTPTEASILLGVLGVAIGIGSVTAGFVSGHHIEPRLIPVGAIGMTVGFFLLGIVPLNFWLIAGLLLGAGFFAGFYIVPLQALLQFLSPDDERGRFLGTANAISFVASTIGSLIFIAAKDLLKMPSNRVFLICCGLAVVGCGLLIFKMRRLISDPALRKRTSESES